MNTGAPSHIQRNKLYWFSFINQTSVVEMYCNDPAFTLPAAQFVFNLVMSVCVHTQIRCIQTYKIITLCAYAQQGYALGRVGLCMYIHVYV